MQPTTIKMKVEMELLHPQQLRIVQELLLFLPRGLGVEAFQMDVSPAAGITRGMS